MLCDDFNLKKNILSQNTMSPTRQRKIFKGPKKEGAPSNTWKSSRDESKPWNRNKDDGGYGKKTFQRGRNNNVHVLDNLINKLEVHDNDEDHSDNK